MNKEITISFVTVCMNRLHHIQQTLLQNIENNLGSVSIEFILLDYSSTDGLREWVQEKASTYLASGVLHYYRVEYKVFFDRSRSRNLAMNLTNGKYVCSVDADNYLGQGFATYIQEQFSSNQNIYLVSDIHQRMYFLRNTFGRFCVLKSDFEKVGGLDEEMKGYGAEIMDLYSRFEAIGLQEKVIDKLTFLQSISHDDEERIKHEFFINQLDKFYISYQDSKSSNILLLYKNGTFEFFEIEPSNENLFLKIKDNSYQKGNVILKSTTCFNGITTKENIVDVKLNKYQLIENEQFIVQAAKLLPFVINKEKQLENTSHRRIKVQNLPLTEKVTKNFKEVLV